MYHLKMIQLKGEAVTWTNAMGQRKFQKIFRLNKDKEEWGKHVPFTVPSGHVCKEGPYLPTGILPKVKPMSVLFSQKLAVKKTKLFSLRIKYFIFEIWN